MKNNLSVSTIYKPERFFAEKKSQTQIEKLETLLKSIINTDEIKKTKLQYIYTKEFNTLSSIFKETNFDFIEDDVFNNLLKYSLTIFYFENDKTSEDEIRSFFEKSPEQYTVRTFDIKGRIKTPDWANNEFILDEKGDYAQEKCDDLYIFAAQKELDVIKNMIKIQKPIFLIGERGTGKTTIVEKYIKKHLKISNENFVSIACGTLEPELAKSELFGYEKNAFTGAIKRTEGKIKKANNGCLFLDEVQDLSKEVQRMLIKGIEDHKFYRVGGTQPYTSNFFLVCSSNRPMSELRESLYDDFYDRVCVIPYKVKSFKEHKDDDKNYISKCLPIIWSNYKQKCSSESPFPEYKRLEEYDSPSEEKSIKERLIDVLYNNELKGNYRDINKLLGYLELYTFNANVFRTYPNNEEINKNINTAINEWQDYITERNLIEEITNAPETFSDDFIKKSTWKNLNKMFKSWVAEQAVRIYGSVNAAAEKLAVDKNVIRNNLQEKKTTDL